jgi:dTDP-4-amino-4,6-dideoxygalactose transaminase
MAELKIFLSSPDVGVAEEEAVVRAMRTGWVAPTGPEVDAFEREVADLVGVGYGVALSSGSAALHLGLKSIGVQPGDSVITSTVTFVATANVIRYVGAFPIFIDSLMDGNINSSLVVEAIKHEESKGRRVAGILPVDVYGRMADYSSLTQIAEKYEIPVLVDAAEAVGASQDGRAAGSFGDGSALSFNGNKIITTSGGGMFLSDSKSKAEYVRYLATQARDPEVHYEHRELGYNYRLSNILAALGRAQLKRLPEMIAKRRVIREFYRDLFFGVEGAELMIDSPKEDNCWVTALLVDSSKTGWGPGDLHGHLKNAGIESRPLWKPMHLQPLYRDFQIYGGEVASELFNRGLLLPSGSGLSDSELDIISTTVHHFLNRH